MFPNAHTSFPVDSSAGQEPMQTGDATGETICHDEVTIKRLRVHYFFSDGKNVEDFYNNCLVQFVLLDSAGKLLAEGQSFPFRHFCLQDGMEMKAEKLFKRVVMHTPKFNTVVLDVLSSSGYHNAVADHRDMRGWRD